MRFTRAGAVTGERGAVAVFVALLMVVLLGFAAIAIDLGALTVEKAELQNGADAAALAIARGCAAGNCGNIVTTAKDLAGSNARDGYATATATITGSTVTVETGTLNKDGSTKLNYLFATALGIHDGSATARASASWASPASGPAVLPLTFSMCQFDAAMAGTTRLIEYKAGVGCNGPTNHPIPGGFGWLSTGGQCSVNVSIATAHTPSDTGNSIPLSSQCITAMQSMKNKTILIPMFEDAGGSGNSGWYKIYGFAAFKITGWKFGGNGQAELNWNNTGSPSCTGNCRGIIGVFQKFVDLGAVYTTGGPDLGAKIVKLGL
ncbi:pilus assembly protein TadG-related protein [Paenarthrobacter sp. RAF54_2]|uniref:pilus assembly protein TadG-related protein n=1 Tax=Paenarthrobacter sp. RAF54_2 TaxID=3233061 RepID=UPI003F99481B